MIDILMISKEIDEFPIVNQDFFSLSTYYQTYLRKSTTGLNQSFTREHLRFLFDKSLNQSLNLSNPTDQLCISSSSSVIKSLLPTSLEIDVTSLTHLIQITHPLFQTDLLRDIIRFLFHNKSDLIIPLLEQAEQLKVHFNTFRLFLAFSIDYLTYSDENDQADRMVLTFFNVMKNQLFHPRLQFVHFIKYITDSYPFVLRHIATAHFRLHSGLQLPIELPIITSLPVRFNIQEVIQELINSCRWVSDQNEIKDIIQACGTKILPGLVIPSFLPPFDCGKDLTLVFQSKITLFIQYICVNSPSIFRYSFLFFANANQNDYLRELTKKFVSGPYAKKIFFILSQIIVIRSSLTSFILEILPTIPLDFDSSPFIKVATFHFSLNDLLQVGSLRIFPSQTDHIRQLFIKSFGWNSNNQILFWLFVSEVLTDFAIAKRIFEVLSALTKQLSQECGTEIRTFLMRVPPSEIYVNFLRESVNTGFSFLKKNVSDAISNWDLVYPSLLSQLIQKIFLFLLTLS